MSTKTEIIIIQGEKFNASWLKTVTLDTAIKTLSLGKYDRNTITNVWKQANGKTVPTTPRKDKDRRDKTEPPTTEGEE